MSRILSTIALILLLAAPTFGQLTPEEALKKFTVAEGLQIELFAAEPDVINPTSIDVDHKGRVWVCEAVNYRRVNFKRPILREEGDRIVVLEDTNADGKTDKSHVFYQGKEIYGPIGICVAPIPPSPQRKQGGQRVFVCQSPDILLFEDLDGDLKADGPPTKFLTGFGGFDHDHGVHGINIGPDGKLYFTVGDQGVKNLQATDGKGPKFNTNQTDCRAGTVWRCDMDGKNLEQIAHNFRNNYECCVNSFGEIWLSDNDDDGNQQTRICHVMPGGNYGYHPRGAGQSHWHEEQPGIVHKVLRTGFGSPTGICFYEGNLLPKKYMGQLMHTDAGPRELRCFHIKPKGAGYEAEKEVLVTSSDNWFRPSDVCVAPDGSLIVADWYDPGVGGHGMGDWTRGRIYRVTPKGHVGYKVPEVKLTGTEGLVNSLASPCLPIRYMANETLNLMPPKEAIAVVLNGISGTDSLQARCFRQMFLIMRRSSPAIIPEEGRKALGEWQGKLMTSRDFLAMLVRCSFEYGLRQQPSTDDDHGPKEHELSAARELLIGLRNQPVEAVKPIFQRAAKHYDGQDRYYLSALNIACGTDPARRDAILADFDKHFPEWNDKVADLVCELRPKSVLPRLTKLLDDAKPTGAQKARIVDILASSDDLTAAQTMLSLLKADSPPEVKARALALIQQFLPGKWKSLQGSKELAKAIDDLLAKRETKVNGLQLIAAANAMDRIDVAAAIALTVKDANSKEENDQRIEAVRTLGQLKSAKAMDALEAMNKPGVPVGELLGIEVMHALGVHLQPPAKNAKENNSPRALSALSGVTMSDKAMPSIRKSAIESLAGTQVGTQWLIDAAEKKQLPPELVADVGKLLRNTPYQGLRNKALLLFPSPGKLDPTKLPPIAELAQRIGNAEKGKEIFTASLKGNTQCARCHTVRGVGGNIGPDLSMIGKKGSKENLFESILQPSKAIADQYLQWQIENTAGQKILGLIMEEGPAGVTIRDANGKDTKIAKGDIESKTKSTTSIMPEDLVKAFTEDELIDVVAYLFTLKTASLTPDSWNILGPFANDAKDSAFDALLGIESKPINLAEGAVGRDGETKWEVVQTLPTGYVDLAAYYRGKSANSASYLHRVIVSTIDQEATILLGSDDGAKIWLNGEKLFENRDHFAATPEKHKVAVKLKKGVNEILLKIVNGKDPHGFYLSVTSNEELKMGVGK